MVPLFGPIPWENTLRLPIFNITEEIRLRFRNTQKVLAAMPT
jgi:hypothetical protein